MYITEKFYDGNTSGQCYKTFLMKLRHYWCNLSEIIRNMPLGM